MYNSVNISEKVAPDFVDLIQNDEERVLYCRVELTDFEKVDQENRKFGGCPPGRNPLTFSVNLRKL